MVAARDAAGDTELPIVLTRNVAGEQRRILIIWAGLILGLSSATEALAEHVGGLGVAIVWTAVLELIVGGAVFWRRWVRSRPQLLLIRSDHIAAVDRSGRELAREPRERVQVEAGFLHAPPWAHHRRQPALRLTLGTLAPMLIGACGLPRVASGAGLRRASYFVGPKQWEALLQLASA